MTRQGRKFVVRRTGGDQPGGSPLADDLAKLADLHSTGLLNDDEFSAAKARLLEGTQAASSKSKPAAPQPTEEPALQAEIEGHVLDA